MLTTRKENWVEMFDLINRTNDALPQTDKIPRIYFPGTVTNSQDSSTGAWARVSIDTLDDRQDTLSVPDGPGGTKRYRTVGLLFIQLFVPAGDSRRVGMLPFVADAFKTAFRKYPHRNGLVFRNARYDASIPAEKSFERANIVVEFEYNEIQ